MSGTYNSEIHPGQPVIYQIRLKGHLGRHWTDWFDGFTITLEDNGETLLTGPVADLAALHERMRAELAAQGAILDDIFYCPHAEGACDCRKPLPGMVMAAQRKWDIDLAASLFIGDGERDRLLAERCGIPFVMVRDGRVVAKD